MWRLSILPWLALGLLSCSPNQSAEPFASYDLDFLCTPEQVAGCSSSTLSGEAFLGLSASSSANCALLLGPPWGMATAYENFAYSSRTEVLPDGLSGGLWGRFQSYFDSSGQPARQIEAGFYRACGFLDLNNNGLFDTGEPFLDEAWNPGTDLLRKFTNWSPAP